MSRPGSWGPTGADAQQIQMLIGLIAAGALDEHLPAISNAIDKRRRQRQRVQSNQPTSQTDIGDRVKLNHVIRPLYPARCDGTTIGWAGQRVIVQLDEPADRFTRPGPLPPTVTRIITDLNMATRPATRSSSWLWCHDRARTWRRFGSAPEAAQVS